MLDFLQLDQQSDTPLYRQVFDQIKGAIDRGALPGGHRLPATRELAGRLGLNRTTVSAAYALLESNGLVEGHVGRGSFVRARTAAVKPETAVISFASSRPAEHEFPLADFQAACLDVATGRDAAAVLQLGSPLGYGPLRHYLLNKTAAEGCATSGDDILITSGCQ